MEKKYGVSSSVEVNTLDEAEALVRKLAELGIGSQVKEINTPAALLPIDPEMIHELGVINFKEFTELMLEIGKDEKRAWSMWGVLLRNTDFIDEHDQPLYEVDEAAIIAKAIPKSRASRRHFENQVIWEQRISRTSLDLATIVNAIQDGSLAEVLNIGPVGWDDMTMVANQRIRELPNQYARVD